MFNISKEIAQAFRTERAIARIGVELVSGEAIEEITEHNIETLIIERSAVSGNVIEIGAARLFELNLRLNNAEGKFDNVQFDGSHLRVRTGVNTKSGVELVPMGLFIVDGHEEDDGDLILTAFDYMVKFDRDADFSGVVFPTTPARLVRYACDKCGVDPSRLDFSNLSNAEYVIEKPPESAVSWRSVLMWCCQILGACAFMDAEGYLIVKWYTDTGEKITSSDRFSHKLFLKDVTVEGVEVVTDDAVYLAGSGEGFIFSIEENELITHDFDSVARNLGAALIGFTHRPFSTPTLSLPHIFPLDMMTYVTPNGEEFAVCVSSYKFTLNGRTELKGVGESETTSGFATLNPLTEHQKAIIAAGLRKVEQAANNKISEAEASLLRLNEVIGNALGLYLVTHTEEDGSTQIYFCDKPTLEQSGLIYAFNAGGFAWATKWNGSNAATVWNYGITRDGNAVLNYLTLNKLTAEQVSVAEIVGAINQSSGESELFISADKIRISGQSLTEYSNGLVTNTSLKNTLSSYVTSTSLSTTLASYAKTSDLASYAKTSELSQFVTSEALSTTLSSYTTNGQLTSALSSYVTSTSLSTTLASYAKTSDGVASSFAYTLTSSGLTMSANGEQVLKVDKDGLEVQGKITATSGTIGGFTITSSSLNNESGGSTIQIAYGSYKAVMSGSSFSITKTDTDGLTSGATFSTSNILLSSYSSTYGRVGIKITTNYSKRTSPTTYNGQNTTVYEGCITAAAGGSYLVDNNITTNGGSFILGCTRTVSKQPYMPVYEWGAYARFENYQLAELVYDSQYSGKWQMRDVSGSSYDLTELIPFLSTHKFYVWAYTNSITNDDTEVSCLKSTHGLSTVLGAVVTTRRTSSDMSGYNYDAVWSVRISGTTVYVGNDDGDATAGFYCIIFGY